MKFISTLAKPEVVLPATAVAAAWMRRQPAEALRMASSVPAALAISEVIKRLVPERRPRPWTKHPNESFPSGHSVGVTAFALSLAAATGSKWVLGAGIAAIAATNVARVHERKHWPIDVFIGDVVGILGALTGEVVARAVRRHEGRRQDVVQAQGT